MGLCSPYSKYYQRYYESSSLQTGKSMWSESILDKLILWLISLVDEASESDIEVLQQIKLWNIQASWSANNGRWWWPCQFSTKNWKDPFWNALVGHRCNWSMSAVHPRLGHIENYQIQSKLYLNTCEEKYLNTPSTEHSGSRPFCQQVQPEV